jgi:hypothetical protein
MAAGDVPALIEHSRGSDACVQVDGEAGFKMLKRASTASEMVVTILRYGSLAASRAKIGRC